MEVSLSRARPGLDCPFGFRQQTNCVSLQWTGLIALQEDRAFCSPLLRNAALASFCGQVVEAGTWAKHSSLMSLGSRLLETSALILGNVWDESSQSDRCQDTQPATCIGNGQYWVSPLQVFSSGRYLVDTQSCDPDGQG